MKTPFQQPASAPEGDGQAEPSRGQRISQLLEQALDLADGEREAFLHSQCGQDQRLHAEISSLLEAFSSAGDFLDEGSIDRPNDEQPGEKIDRYKLLQKVGEGGMGSVWMAEQLEPVRRRVAIKLIKLGMDSKQVVARFEAERQALALMDHPNIATVLDGGMTDKGRLFFVMELVRGVPITEYCDEMQLSTSERLALFDQVCKAVQHAHMKGVIHRDLKPNNILVTLHDGVPVPKVIDFGIAKATNAELTQRTLFTEFRQMVGTPEYMAPEQAEMSGLDVDTRADVYSLGVLLYELLTGTKPFEAIKLLEKGYSELVQHIREVDPPRPSTRVQTLGGDLESVADRRDALPKELSRTLRGDLDWIAMRALEKDRRRRYPSALSLAADIERHLNDQPVEASPPSTLYRTRKLVRRHRGWFASAAVALTLLIAGLIGTGLALDRAVDAEALAFERAEEAEREKTRAISEQERAKREASRFAAVNRFVLDDMLGAVDPRNAQGSNPTVRDVLDTVADSLLPPPDSNIPGSLDDDLDVKMEVLNTVGTLYTKLALTEQAEPFIQGAVELSQGLEGPREIDHARYLLSHAKLLLERGEYDASLQVAQQSLKIRERLAPDDLQKLISTRGLIAQIEDDRGNWKAAVDSLEQSLGLMGYGTPDETNPAADQDMIATVLQNQAAILMRQGELETAETKLLDAMERLNQAYDPPHPELASGLGNLASLHKFKGDLDRGIALQREATEMRRQLYGEEHTAYALSLNNLADTLMAKKGAPEFEEAERLLLRSLDIYSRLLPEDHATLGLINNNLGYLMQLQKRNAEAEPYLSKGVAIMAREMGAGHTNTLGAQNNLGVLNYRLGQKDKGIQILQAALTNATQSVGPANPARSGLVGNLFFILKKETRYEEAERLLLEDWQSEQTSSSPEAHQRQALERLIQFYNHWNKVDPQTKKLEQSLLWSTELDRRKKP